MRPPQVRTPPAAALLMLADGRFPAGGHAHSGGVEAAVAAGRLTELESLGAFLAGRAATAGVVSASFAAAACAAKPDARSRLAKLDAELGARIPSPALRAASRSLGRQLLRAARSIRPDRKLDVLAEALPDGPHQPVALGTAAAAFGVGPRSAATAALHEAVAGPAAAAIRLLGLDPFAVHAVLVGLADQLDTLADTAAGQATAPAASLPAPSAPMLDISAEDHAAWEVRLFAS